MAKTGSTERENIPKHIFQECQSVAMGRSQFHVNDDVNYLCLNNALRAEAG